MRHLRRVVLVLALGGCAGVPTADERLRAACADGDAPSCAAVDGRAAPPAEPEVRDARDPLLRDPSVAVGVSSDRGVGVGVGGRVGRGLRIGVGLGL